VLALALPTAAHPFSLDELIRLPFEHLLQLEISPRRLSSTEGPATTAAARAALEGRHHAV